MQSHVRWRWMALLGTLLFLTGFARLYRIGMQAGPDFPCFYTAAHRYVHGENPYLVSGDPLHVAEAARGAAPPVVLSWYLYTPLTSALLSPLALFSAHTARVVWFLGTFGVMYLGIWLALSVIAPDWHPAARWCLLGLSTHAVTAYWIALQLQVTTLMVGALGLVLYAELRRKEGLLLAAGVLATCKPTFFLPVICLLAFRRRWGALGAILGAFVVLNLIAALPTGIPETIAGYRVELANAQAPGTNNYANAHETMRKYYRLPPLPIQTTPGTRFAFEEGAVGEHLSWTYLFSGLTSSYVLAQRLSNLATLLSLIALACLWWQSRALRDDPEFALRLYAVVICLSLLCIYHLRYDSVMLLYPFFIGVALTVRRFDAAMAAVAACCFALSFLMINAVSDWIFLHLVVPGDHVWLVPFRSYGITVVFLIAFWGTWRYAARRQEAIPEVQPAPALG